MPLLDCERSLHCALSNTEQHWWKEKELKNITIMHLCNILWFFTAVKIFSDEKLWYFSYFCSKHWLWALIRTTLLCIHNWCFEQKKNIRIFHLKIGIFRAVKYRSILHWSIKEMWPKIENMLHTLKMYYQTLRQLVKVNFSSLCTCRSIHIHIHGIPYLKFILQLSLFVWKPVLIWCF